VIVCLDANVVIYYVERNPIWEPKVTARFKAIAADYQKFFASPDVQMLPVTTAVWQRAAELRSAFKLKPLDSIHLASAAEHGCGLFLTNDAPLARCTAMAVEVLT
jgi:uncharacterized protein